MSACVAVPDKTSIFNAITPMVAGGAALHWLRRREKAPVAENWSTAPVATFDHLKAAYRSGYNLGIRLGEQSKTAAGYLHILDIDIRDAAQAPDAWSAVIERWPEARNAPFVVSGSGGESRHLYFVTDRPFRSHKLAKSAGFDMVFDPKKGREVKKRHWEVELFGSGKQVVLPPSIHPDSGEPYTWGRALHWDLLELGVGPILRSDMVAEWGASEDDLTPEGEDDDLMAMVRAAPMGLSEDEIDRIVEDLPPDWVEDRDQWLQVGMALCHEFEGSARGFEIWCEWSSQSEKYDARDQATVWKSFKGRTAKPVRMPTLIKAAADHRLAREHGDLEQFDDLSDLLGPPPSRALTVQPSAMAADLADLIGPPMPPRPIAPGAAGVTLTYDDDWMSLFDRNGEGKLKAGLHNICLIMRNDKRLRGVVACNKFTNETVMIKTPALLGRSRERPKPILQLQGDLWRMPDPINGKLWSDSHDAQVRRILEAPESQGGYGIKAPGRDMEDAILTIQEENICHPVKTYLESLTWDGVPRMTQLFVDYVGAPDNEYSRFAARLWLVGAVARTYEPGHKFDFVPILEGLQGVRKSSFFRALAKHWFAELEGDFHDKKTMVEQMQGAWIIEMPELQGFSRAEVTTIKGFVSRTKDKVRLSYGHRAAEFPRQCVFGGTTNESEYLRDSTGGRRFWPIECTVSEIDIDRLTANVDQVWAETLAIYREWRASRPHGELPLYMTNEAAASIAKEMQESRRQVGADEVLAGQIADWLESPIGSDTGFDEVDEPEYRLFTCSLEIWVEMMGRDRSTYSDRDQQMLSRALRKVPGWQPCGRRSFPRGIGQQRAYEKIFHLPTTKENDQ